MAIAVEKNFCTTLYTMMTICHTITLGQDLITIQRRVASFIPARDFSAFRFLPSFRNISYLLKEHYE